MEEEEEKGMSLAKSLGADKRVEMSAINPLQEGSLAISLNHRSRGGENEHCLSKLGPSII